MAVQATEPFSCDVRRHGPGARPSNGSRAGPRAIVIPLARDPCRAWRSSRSSCCWSESRRIQFYRAHVQRRVRHLVLDPEHAVAGLAAASGGALRGAAGAARSRGHRWRGGDRARRYGGRGRSLCRSSACPAAAASGSSWAWPGMAIGGDLDRHRRRAAPLPRRQRDHLLAADGLYRHRADEPFRRRAAARPGQPQQAVDRAAARAPT